PCGKRDYAILLLLATYGLRAREVAALTLDDIDWKRERLAVPERKAGHSTAFPLSRAAGEALADYLRHGRPQSRDRHVFFRAMAPLRPLGTDAISSCARRYLLRARIQVPRPGSHTLRHSAVQRLVDAGFPLKTIGDYAGHRSAASTQIYGKVAVESLRQVALGDGEEALRGARAWSPPSTRSSRTSGRSGASTTARRTNCGCWCASPASTVSAASAS